VRFTSVKFGYKPPREQLLDPDHDGKWHHVVGVVDEANTNQYIYIDGLRRLLTG